MREPDRSAGYLSDTTYPDRFHRELAPSWLSYAGVQGGAPPRKLDAPFTYLDLGCGFAHSTVVNAGAYPHAEFHACDFNPLHIAAARRHAERLGVTNLHLHECLFEALLERPLPDFDFIVLHGVYSWVSAEVCRTIQRIIELKLKPGGFAYVSYNCLPGWAAEIPLRRLFLELSRGMPGSSEQRMRGALSELERLATPSFRYFRDNPEAKRAVESFKHEPANYLAHEFLNEAWTLYYSLDVAADLERAGATYLASATLTDNHPVLLIDKAAAEAIARLPTPRQQQLALDFAVNQRFRRDLFIKGPLPPNNPLELLRHLDATPVGCTTELDQIGTQALIPRGKLTFQEAFIRDLRAVLGHGALSIGDIVARLSGPGRNATEIRQNLVFLVAAGTLTPFARVGESPSPTPGAALYPPVEKALRHIVATQSAAVVPSLRLGNGALVTPSEAEQALAWLDSASPHATFPRRLARLGLLAPA